ncbi:MAG: CoA transferase [Chloroflexi bacterium]|nr:CoA transferase [Chloroflexota bacterium]
MSGCLEGVRILELARFQAAPRAGMIMSDLGAEVIKVEKVGGEETRSTAPVYKGQSIYFSAYNRGKKSITLDLHSEVGRRILKELVACSDVVLENFRPGVMSRMGLAYSDLRQINPGIILVSISGFGQYGPYTDRPAFDSIGQAMSGLMYLTGAQFGQPVITASSIIDRVAALYATIGTLGALYYKRFTGRGQLIDTCLMDAALTLTEVPLANYLLTSLEGPETGSKKIAPSGFRAKDGWVVVIPGTKAVWGRLLRAIGQAALAEDPSYAGIRVDKPHLRNQLLVDWVAQHTVAEVVSILTDAEVPCGPVNTVAQAARDPHLWERELLVEVEDQTSGKMFVPGLSIKLSETPGTIGRVPTPGEHNEEIYGRLLSYSHDQIVGLQRDGVI